MRALSLNVLLLATAPASAVPSVFTTNEHANARRFLDVGFTNRSGAIVIGLLDRTGCFRINRVFPRSPAGRAGLRAGEILRNVNGIDVRGKPLHECLSLLSGSSGNRFAVEISKADKTKTRTISLVREKFLAAD